MRRPTLTLVLPVCLAVGALSSFRVERRAPAPAAPPTPREESHAEGEHAEAPAVEEGPARYLRAPVGVVLEVTEDAWLRAPGADWFEKQAEAEPGRYSFDASLMDGEGGWVDSEGEYQLRYDEEEDVYAYWQYLSAERLTLGRRDFVQYCSSCHGLEGDGYGRSAQHLRPSPRSFKQANFKFTKVTKPLPTDAALEGLIRKGLNGTPMLPWQLSDRQLDDIVQYIKSLSPPETGWRDLFTDIGDPVEAGEDPWADGDESEAIAQGEMVYHGTASCYACHPGYVTPKRLAELRGEPEGTEYREDLSYPALKESTYTVLGKQVKILPPDFTWHDVRSGTTPRDLFQTIAAGIKGTAMPQWKGALSDSDIWATAHYVHHLISEYKDQPDKRSAFMSALRRDQ